MGRPPRGMDHIEDLEGPEETKRRVKVVFETLAGRYTVKEASELLGIGEARFHELRHQVLEGAMQGLAPGMVGRPPREEPVDRSRVEELEREVLDLKMALVGSWVRTEIALVLPHLLKTGESKKNRVRTKAKRRRHRK